MLPQTSFSLLYFRSNIELDYFIQLVSQHQTFARGFKSLSRNFI